MKIAIIGAGRVGLSLVKVLWKNFKIISICEKNEKEIGKFRKEYKSLEYIGTNPYSASINADVIFITTQDDFIEKVCNEIFENRDIRDKYVFHCSGSLPSTILNSAKKNNCYIGSMHPLQTVPDEIKGPENLKKAYFCLEGDNEAVEVAKKIVEKISGKYFIISPENKSLYHLGAVFSSNFINTMAYIGFKIYEKIGIVKDDKEFLEIISPLIDGAINGIKSYGIYKSLTGPIVRGDVNTLKRHVEGINKDYPEIRNLYKEICKITVELAEFYYKDKDYSKLKEFLEKNLWA